MAYEDNPYRDEDGEALMDYDDMPSDREPSPQPRHDLLDDDVEDWDTRERSQTPVYDNDKVGKPKKRLIKKSTIGKESVAPELIDEEDDYGFGAEDEFGGGEDMERKKRKKGKEGGGGGGGGASGKKEKKFKGEKKYMSSGGKGSGSKSGFAPRKGMMDSGRLSAKDREVDEMWTHVGANDEVLYSF